jgi:hypothetical protein
MPRAGRGGGDGVVAHTRETIRPRTYTDGVPIWGIQAQAAFFGRWPRSSALAIRDRSRSMSILGPV